MKHASTGLTSLRFEDGLGFLGFLVALSTFDETGWMDRVSRWESHTELEKDATTEEVEVALGAFIARETGMSTAEANSLAAEGYTGWKAKGGEHQERREAVLGLGLLTAIGSGILLTIAVVLIAVVVAVVLLLRLF